MGKFKGVEGFRFDANVFEKADSIAVASDEITVEYGGNTYIIHGSFEAATTPETGDGSASGDDAEDDDRETDDDGGETDEDSGDGDGGSDDAGDDDQRVAGTITGIEVKHGGTTLFKAAGLTIEFGKFDDEARHHGSAASRKLLMSGDDSIVGSHGRDKLEGHDGDDRLHGDDGNDDLSGGAGRDRLDGGTGSDKLSGGAGNDHLDGGAGADLLAGGVGADVFEFDTVKDSAKGKSHDTISDYKSNDDIDVSGIDANTKARGDQAFDFIGNDHFSHHTGELRLAGKVLFGDVDGDGKADFQVEFSHIVHLSDHSFIL